MNKGMSRVTVKRLGDDGARRLKDLVVREIPVTLVFNDIELGTLMCSPQNLDYLAIGFLFAEGLVKGRKDVGRLLAEDKDGVVWVETKRKIELPEDFIVRRSITTGCGRGLTFVDLSEVRSKLATRSKFSMPADSVPALMKKFLAKSRLFKATGGAHSAALCNSREVLVFNEDIGRHNAVDKVFGECVLKGIRTKDRILVTSGRISSEILIKAARAKVPIVISKTAPTELAIRLAKEFGVTLIGFARGQRMNVYSNEWRAKSRRSSTASSSRKKK